MEGQLFFIILFLFSIYLILDDFFGAKRITKWSEEIGRVVTG